MLVMQVILISGEKKSKMLKIMWDKKVFIKIIPHIANHDFLLMDVLSLEEYLEFKHLG